MTKFLVGLEKFLHSLTHSFCRHIVKTFTFLYLFLKQQKVLHLFCQHPTESPETSRFMFIGTQCDLWGRPDGTGKQETDREIKLSTHKDNINDRLEQCQITGRDLP